MHRTDTNSNTWSRRRFGKALGGSVALAGWPAVTSANTRSYTGNTSRMAQEVPEPRAIGGELNILVLAGYDEPQIIEPFEELFGVEVNSRVVPSSDETFAMLQASEPGDWDVAVPDTPWIERFQAADLIEPIDLDDFPMIADQYEQWQEFDQLEVDGTRYGIVSRWGLYGIVYNSNYIEEEEAQTISVMYDEAHQGNVVLFDWYLPNMGMIGRYAGFDQPYDVSDEEFEEIRDLTFELRPQVGVIAATNADTIQALAMESGYLSFGGEWLQLLLKEEGYPIELAVPQEGGVSWTEAVVQLKDAQNPEAATAFMQYLLSPEPQAKLAWANAFHATVPNKRAVEFLTPEQAEALRMEDPAQIDEILSTIATRKLPADESLWADTWDEFKSL